MSLRRRRHTVDETERCRTPSGSLVANYAGGAHVRAATSTGAYSSMRRIRVAVVLALASVTVLLVAGSAAAAWIVTEPLPTGYVGVPYSYQVKVDPNAVAQDKASFRISSGALPPGLSMSLSGLIT